MKAIRIGSRSHKDEGCSITVENLSQEEAGILQGMLRGMNWTTVESGRLKSAPRFKPLPGPADDLEMMPYWRRAEFPLDGRLQVNTYDPERLKNRYGAGIYISSLCGYYFTPENYQREAGKLISWGFQCMRSRREADGGYWETWYLPGVWAAKGQLKIKADEVKLMKQKNNDRAELDTVISYLCRHVSFGSMDVAVQCAAMGPPD